MITCVRDEDLDSSSSGDGGKDSEPEGDGHAEHTSETLLPDEPVGPFLCPTMLDCSPLTLQTLLQKTLEDLSLSNFITWILPCI